MEIKGFVSSGILQRLAQQSGVVLAKVKVGVGFRGARLLEWSFGGRHYSSFLGWRIDMADLTTALDEQADATE